MVINIIAGILGFIAAVLIYPWFNGYVLALIAFLGAVCVGIFVYYLASNILAGLLNDSRRI